MASPTSKSSKWTIRPVHRVLGSMLMLFTLYYSVTGTVMQSVDLHAILTHAPATDKEMVQVREGINGPSNYVVIQPTDYAAPSLPQDFDYASALATVVRGARGTLGEAAPMKFVELRNVGSKATGVVQSGDKTFYFDAMTGTPVAAPPRFSDNAAHSIHLTFKVLHSLRAVGNWVAIVSACVAAGLFVMIVTGLVLYFRLLRARSRAGLKAPFWSAGGRWRSLHRGVSILAAAFLLVVSASGTMLALDTFGTGMYQLTHKHAGKYARFPIGSIGDFSSPLPDAKLPAMLQTALAAARGTAGATPIKAVRLRYFNGIPQGVVIGGTGDGTGQYVFHAETGKPMSLTEAGYPETHYHFGWREHEIMKKIHRGDFFGLPGRMMDLFAGLSLIFLSISGAVMYVDLWRRRRRGGRAALFWA